ncbi:phosphatidylglycerol lysyltransferase domain-containing protein [Brevibacillus fluminis]|uniref:phosphatidylglycerol lysyltransferase domain-containing protein n=1 Tax=Brevibacillus fluminis TaxID=511487 RepID=UPI003F8C5253
MKLGQHGFRRIRLRDKAVFDEYMKMCEYPANLWSSNFAYLWADSQADKRQVYWKIIDGMLVPLVYLRGKGLHVCCLPFGKGGPDHVLRVVARSLWFCNRWNRQHGAGKATVRALNESQLAFLRSSARFRKLVEKWKIKGIEMHYDVEKLLALKGKDFANVRNILNRFRRNYPDVTIRRGNPGDLGHILRVSKNWRKTAGKKYDVVFDDVYFREIVAYQEELDHLVLVAENKEKIVGVVTGGVLPTGESWGCLIKKIDQIDGLNEWMVIEFVKEISRINPQTKLLNVGSDLGMPGLSVYKQKFRPVLNLKRYRMRLR